MIKYALLFLTILTIPSQAMDMSEWFHQQHNAKGQSCCDRADGNRYDGYYQMNSDGSVTLAQNKKIEAWKVLLGPNPTGHAILWSSPDGHIWCFSPGPGL